MDIEEIRLKAIARKNLGWPVSQICKELQISKKTFYRWLGSYKTKGKEGLIKKSTRPKTIHYHISYRTKQRIISIRKEHGYCAETIEQILKSKGINVSHTSIYKILNKEGLITHLKRKRRQRTYVRWERLHSNSLWQTDFKLIKRNQWLNAYIDDCSRFVLSARIFDAATAEYTISLLEEAIEIYGKPREVLSDHGTQFYAVRGGISSFTKFCADNKIRHVLSGIGKPTTTGKIERFFRTFDVLYGRFGDIDEVVEYYNNYRIHQSIGYITPKEKYLRSFE